MAGVNMSPIAENIELLSREKNIDSKTIIDAITEAVLKAYQKQYRNLGEEVDVRYNPDTGQIEIFAQMTVVEDVIDPAKEISLEEANELVEGAEVGDILEIQRPFEGMGRIAAQTAKQVITQKVREAERNNVYEEYIQHVGELVNGFVKRFEKRGDIIVDLGSVEALLPRSEQSKVEKFSLNERIRAAIIKVTKDVKETHGQQVILSRTRPEVLIRLFEMEVPEIYDGTVQIKGAVREPGDRAKLAVTSIDRDVDPVGACVGMKGSRVQAVIRELHGEKIDIIEWSENPAIFAANALSPAKVNKVQIIDPATKKIEVIVEDDQQSLAIGKQGQNVRLAAKLVGWSIDIRSESDVKREVASQMEQLISVGETPLTVAEAELGPKAVAVLTARGIESLEQVAAVEVDELAETLDCSLDVATNLIQTAQSVLAQRKSRTAQAPEAVPAETEALMAEPSGEPAAGQPASPSPADEAAEATEPRPDLAAPALEEAPEPSPEQIEPVSPEPTEPRPDLAAPAPVAAASALGDASPEAASELEDEAGLAGQPASESTLSTEMKEELTEDTETQVIPGDAVEAEASGFVADDTEPDGESASPQTELEASPQ